MFINTRAVLIGGNPNCASVYLFHDCRLGGAVTANTSSALSVIHVMETVGWITEGSGCQWGIALCVKNVLDG